jgi:hypothetical protein
MTCNTLSRFSMYFCTGLFAMVLPYAVQADPIFFNNLRFDNPVGFSTGFAPDSVVFGNVSNGFTNYAINAELCEAGFCQFDSPGADTSSQLRLTNLTITCSAEGSCPALDISFEAQGSTTGAFGRLQLSMDNGSFSGQDFTGSAIICIASGGSLCTSNLSGPLSSSFSFNQNLSGSLSIPFDINGNFTVFGDLHLDGLQDATTVQLGSSFDITDITDAGSVPEPGTIALFPAGLTAIYLLRRRSAARKRPKSKRT